MRVVVGLGANLGDRLASLRGAVVRLRALGEVVACSKIHETDFVGEGAQPPYLNAAVLMTSALEPLAFMEKLLAIEAAMGRVRTKGTHPPRTIDLDVLWIESITLSNDALTVPHPRLLERAFALGPLLEVAPHAFPEAIVDRSSLREFGSFF